MSSGDNPAFLGISLAFTGIAPAILGVSLAVPN
jgi:hypothetical protein